MIKSTLLVSWFIFILIIAGGSSMVLQFEQTDVHSNIKTYSDALWWSINVASAVGDCSLSPSTLGGRVVSVIMMILGYAIFTINVSALVAFFHKHVHSK